MIQYFRRHLGAKLFLSYLVIMVVGAVVLSIATRFTIPVAFQHHMGAMQGTGQEMMQGYSTGSGMMSDLFLNFRASFNEALLLALLAAGIAAVLISLLLTRGITTAVQAVIAASQHIADGHYTERVRSKGNDELGQLAGSFNRMAERLEQTETMRRQLIGDVSHELRTPLTAIKGSMEGLMDGVLLANAETYQHIHAEVDRLARLVDDLQELSRVEAGAVPLEIHPNNLATMIISTIKRLLPQAQMKSIIISSELPKDLPLVRADERRITQVLTNLIANAVQYTPEGGRVVVAAQREGQEVMVHITDTGIGIPEEHIPRLFTRFYRVDKSRSRQAGGGSGIGLAIARHLVEAHSGRIWAESEGEGKGSTFSFSLKIVG